MIDDSVIERWGFEKYQYRFRKRTIKTGQIDGELIQDSDIKQPGMFGPEDIAPCWRQAVADDSCVHTPHRAVQMEFIRFIGGEEDRDVR